MGAKNKPLKLMEFSRLVTKRACLKCRNPIDHYRYNCPNCNGFYCQYCAETLKRKKMTCIYCKEPIKDEFNLNQVEERIETLVS
ncbi:MAG: hypothetical protein JW891_17380 [Candidatus Lokiarchaeota archaeon]|nr:hypothetical protein [Candidatus Lokiarchaeota archaeon]